MKRHLLWARPIGVLVAYLGGCAVMATVPPGEVVYEPPAVVEEPAVSVWAWWPWPHYEVEHNYVVEHDHVIIPRSALFPVVWAISGLHPQRQR